jgi:ribosomal-protein-alanine N-acetyltransferase
MRTLRSAVLRLEPQVAAHADEMFAVLSDPAIYEYENEPPQSVEWLRERYTKLESRRSRDGSEQWLNWVVRLPTEEPIGYVQATLSADRSAGIAYVFGSRHWGKGYASEAVRLMIDELAQHYGVDMLSGVYKRANWRSARLLQRLGFTPATPDWCRRLAIDPDEAAMLRPASSGAKATSVC